MSELRLLASSFAVLFYLGINAVNANEPHHHPQKHEDDTEKHKTHVSDAHIHGAWELFAALDENQLSVTIKGPIVDVLGFEHPPESKKDRSSVESLKAQIETPDTFLLLGKRAGCVLATPAQILMPQEFSVDNASDEATSDTKNTHHDHDIHEADDHHHENAHDNDLEVNYVFTCKSPSRLSEITASGFTTFPDIEYIEAVYLASDVQKALRLKKDSNILRLN